MTDTRKNVVGISTNDKVNTNEFKTEEQKLKDKIKELEATNKMLQQIIIHTTPIIKILLPYLKDREEIKKESIQAVEKMLQLCDFLNTQS